MTHAHIPRQATAASYRLGLPSKVGTPWSKSEAVSTKEADWRRVGAVMVQELMMGSELGYEEAMSNLAWVLEGALEQRYLERERMALIGPVTHPKGFALSRVCIGQ